MKESVCGGVYSQNAIPGGTASPGIYLSIPSSPSNTDFDISYLIYEWDDTSFLGKSNSNGVEWLTCGGEADNTAVLDHLCNETERGKFLVKDGNYSAPIVTEMFQLKNFTTQYYPVTKTGWYCVIAYVPFFIAGLPSVDFQIEIENPYGLMPAIGYPLLPVNLRCSCYTHYWRLLLLILLLLLRSFGIQGLTFLLIFSSFSLFFFSCMVSFLLPIY